MVRPMLTIGAPIDHRFVDGFPAESFARSFRHVLADPWRLDAPPSGTAVAEVPAGPASLS